MDAAACKSFIPALTGSWTSSAQTLIKAHTENVVRSSIVVDYWSFQSHLNRIQPDHFPAQQFMKEVQLTGWFKRILTYCKLGRVRGIGSRWHSIRWKSIIRRWSLRFTIIPHIWNIWKLSNGLVNLLNPISMRTKLKAPARSLTCWDVNMHRSLQEIPLLLVKWWNWYGTHNMLMQKLKNNKLNFWTVSNMRENFKQTMDKEFCKKHLPYPSMEIIWTSPPK